MKSLDPLSHSVAGTLAAFSAVAAFWCLPLHSSAQGTFEPLIVSFDGPPLQPPGSAHTVQSYPESGVWFGPFRVPMALAGGEQPNRWLARRWHPYLQAALGDSLMFGLDEGSSFDPVSVDLAEYSDILLLMQGPETVHFVGYRQDGTVLTTDITTAGIFNGVAPVFTNFTFDPGFSGLVPVKIPTFPSLDNLTLQRSVPEPGTGALVGLGAALLGLRSLKRRSRP